jgi:SAM-dependent methyltransferase
MSIGGRSGGGVSEQAGGRGTNSEARDHTRPMRRENGLRHNFPDRLTERTDGTGGFVDAVMGAAIGPYRKSRLKWLDRGTLTSTAETGNSFVSLGAPPYAEISAQVGTHVRILDRTRPVWLRLLLRPFAPLIRPILVRTDGYLRQYIKDSDGRIPAKPPRLGWMNTTLKSEEQVKAATAEVQRCGLVPHVDRQKHWDAISALRFICDRRKPDDRVLEVGATLNSVMLPWLYQCGYRHLRGIDLVFDRAVHRGCIVYEPGDLTHTRFTDCSFDIICSMSVIEHGVPVSAYFSEMARLLSPGGLLITSTDYWKDPVDARGQTAFGEPIKVFTPQEIEELLRASRTFGFAQTGPIDLVCQDRAVTWGKFKLSYSFLCFALEKQRTPSARP